jgi:hypothetical protein
MTIRNVLTVVAVFIFLVLEAIRRTRLGGAWLLEMRARGYSAQDAHDLLDELGPSGRSRYAGFQRLDFAFIAAAAGAMLAGDLGALEHLGATGPIRLVTALPIAYATADVAEDVALLAMIRAFPQPMSGVSRAASRLTSAKLLLFIASLLATLILFVASTRK